MSTYLYKARDTNGQLISGTIEADDEAQAANQIEQLNLSPVDISTRSGFESLSSLFELQFSRISHQEVLIFTRQLATLTASGVSLIASLENIGNQSRNNRFKAIISDLINSLKGGVSLSESLAKYPQVFSNLYISLVRVGETGGVIDKVLKRLSDLSTQDIDLRSRLRAALIYPTVLALVAFLIVNFVLVGVLPRFVTIFDASSANLPLPTIILMGFSGFVRNFWWLILGGIVVGAFGFHHFYKSEAGRYRVDSLILKLPLFGDIILKIMVCRFSRSVAALTKSGIPVLEALTVVEKTISNMVLQKIIGNVRTAISRGESLTTPFQESGLFPLIVIQLINTGERTGKLGDMFDEIANFYEPEIDYTVRNLTSLLEPVMLLVMGGIVAFIALSVLLPIFNLIKIIRR